MGDKVRAIYILFGDVKGYELLVPEMKEGYLKYKHRLEDKGYTLAIPEFYCSKQALQYLVRDSATVGVVWDSHGFYSGDNPLAELSDSKGESIKFSDITGANKEMQVVALLGCGIGARRQEWIKAFGLNRLSDARRFFATGLTLNSDQEKRAFINYEFPYWIDHIL
jgi:hypothetical protein